MDASFGRRLRLFLIGVVIGSIAMYFMVFRERDLYKTPTKIIQERVLKHPSSITPRAQCLMECYQVLPNDIRLLVENSDIAFSKSDVHRKPSPIYRFEPETPGKLVAVWFEVGDTTSTLLDLEFANGSSACPCPAASADKKEVK
jgi:hypothetical protein